MVSSSYSVVRSFSLQKHQYDMILKAMKFAGYRFNKDGDPLIGEISKFIRDVLMPRCEEVIKDFESEQVVGGVLNDD